MNYPAASSGLSPKSIERPNGRGVKPSSAFYQPLDGLPAFYQPFTSLLPAFGWLAGWLTGGLSVYTYCSRWSSRVSNT
ncbi:MAG TPA: hypothetical protein PK874_07025 [Desulfobacteraceae bacterium]|nr:hypothetical protein [Desulfobacteraceae bacterium]HPJ66750.1 hypothetical protein [Desulfobacteraceae bacterium]